MPIASHVPSFMDPTAAQWLALAIGLWLLGASESKTSLLAFLVVWRFSSGPT